MSAAVFAALAQRARQRQETPDAPPHPPEPPRPLVREMTPADPYPVHALGPLLSAAATAIQDVTQAPLALCGSAVLATGSLAVQAHVDVELPTGQARPASLFILSIAGSGERKTAVDGQALWPVRKHEHNLRQGHQAAMQPYLNELAAWESARKSILAEPKKTKADKTAALNALGSPPRGPLMPIVATDDATVEGLARLFLAGQPSMGLFASEGGTVIGGHAMSDDARIRSAASYNKLWDGAPLDRVRATGEAIVLPGRRLAMHVMAQPDLAAGFLADAGLVDQGLTGRFLLTAPDSTAGTRLWRDAASTSELAIKTYGARVLALLERPAPLVNPDNPVALAPASLPLSVEARRLWIEFYNRIEGEVGRTGELDCVRPLANKAAEHAARVAAVLTVIETPDAREIPRTPMAGGIEIVQHHLAEAVRLATAGRVEPYLRDAQRVLAWLATWPHDAISLPDIYQHGPGRAVRDKAAASRVVETLASHGWLVEIPGGADIAGVHRRTAWKVVR